MNADATTAPPWLEDDDALERWRRFEAEGVLESRDPSAVAACCLLETWWHRALRTLERVEAAGDETVTLPDEGCRRHPVFQLEELLAHLLHDLKTSVGLESDGRSVRRPTRILFLDEGDSAPER